MERIGMIKRIRTVGIRFPPKAKINHMTGDANTNSARRDTRRRLSNTPRCHDRIYNMFFFKVFASKRPSDDTLSA